MPRVPTYQPFQVQPTVGPGPSFDAPRGPTPTGIAAEQLGQAGEAVAQAGGALSQYALNQQQQLNIARINDEKHKFAQAVRDTEIKMRELQGAELVTPGEDGRAPIDVMRSDLDDMRRAMLEGMPNDFIRRNLGPELDNIYLRYSDRSMAYEAEQAESYRQNVLLADIEYQGSVVALDPTDEDARNALMDGIDQYATTVLGFNRDDRAYQNYKEEAFYTLFSGEIERMVSENNFGGAQALLDAVKADLSPIERAALQNDIQEGQRAGRVFSTVDGYVSSGLSQQQALEQAGNITDAAERELVETRIITVYARKTAAETLERTQLVEKYGDLIRTGEMIFSQIPGRDKRKMDQRDLDYLEGLGTKPDTVTNMMVYAAGLEIVRGDPEQIVEFVASNRDNLSIEDQRALLNKGFTERSKEPGDPRYSATYTQLVNAKVEQYGLDDAEKAQLLLQIDAFEVEYLMMHPDKTRVPQAEISNKMDELSRDVVLFSRSGEPGFHTRFLMASQMTMPYTSSFLLPVTEATGPRERTRTLSALSVGAAGQQLPPEFNIPVEKEAEFIGIVASFGANLEIDGMAAAELYNRTVATFEEQNEDPSPYEIRKLMQQTLLGQLPGLDLQLFREEPEEPEESLTQQEDDE